MENEDDDIIQLESSKYALSREWREIEHKLAHLLLEEVIFCNNGWWLLKEGRPWQKDYITHHVNCNDVFAWGCADAEDITYNELPEFYHDFWQKDPVWGAAAWCIRKRKQIPQRPVEERIRKQGIWNLDELVKGKPNESSGT